MLTLDPSDFDPARIDPETAAFNARIEPVLTALPAPGVVPVIDLRAARARGEGPYPLAGPRDGSLWQTIPGGQRVRVSPWAGTPRGIYLHLHGGGWTFNAPDQYDAVNQAHATATGMTVIAAEYRLAPEHIWPACLHDCRAALDWVLAEWPGLPVVIGGESAGAHLTAAVLVDAGRQERIRGAVLNYGIFDFRMTPSMALWGTRNLVLNTPIVAWYLDNVAPDGVRRDDPALSPLLAPLTGMPPALFQVGTMDPLLDDTLMMAARWVGAGNAAELAVYPGGIHAFDMFDLAIARAFAARQQAFMSACLGP